MGRFLSFGGRHAPGDTRRSQKGLMGKRVGARLKPAQVALAY